MDKFCNHQNINYIYNNSVGASVHPHFTKCQTAAMTILIIIVTALIA